MLASILASALAMTAVQDDMQSRCEAYQAEYGGSSDCACLAEKVEADADLMAMMEEITSPEDLENAPSEVQEAIEECS
jgi:hypothetical protein